MYSSDLGPVLVAIGHPEYASQAGSYGDQVKQASQIAVDDINKRGGLHGCPVSVVFYDYKISASDGWDAESQRACSYFTQDQPVSFVVTGLSTTRVLPQCLSQHGVAMQTPSEDYQPDQPDYDKFKGYLFGPQSIRYSRHAALMDVFAKAGYLSPGAKVAIVAGQYGYDGTDYQVQDVKNRWVPRLHQLGVKTVEVYVYTHSNGVSDGGNLGPTFSGFIIDMKAKGIDHVIFPRDSGQTLLFFPQVAQSQDFHPRYGQVGYTLGPSTTPQSEFRGAISIPFSPTDVYQDSALYKQNPPSAIRDQCVAVYSKQNVSPDFAWCDTLEWLRAVFAKENPSVQALLRGTEALGKGYKSGYGFGATTFGPGRYDGLTQVRAMALDNNSVLSYVTPVIDVP
jgi:ABC-type branched-subunit amino acid transport system substrate-binding protein